METSIKEDISYLIVKQGVLTNFSSRVYAKVSIWMKKAQIQFAEAISRAKRKTMHSGF